MIVIRLLAAMCPMMVLDFMQMTLNLLFRCCKDVSQTPSAPGLKGRPRYILLLVDPDTCNMISCSNPGTVRETIGFLHFYYNT